MEDNRGGKLKRLTTRIKKACHSGGTKTKHNSHRRRFFGHSKAKEPYSEANGTNITPFEFERNGETFADAIPSISIIPEGELNNCNEVISFDTSKIEAVETAQPVEVSVTVGTRRGHTIVDNTEEIDEAVVHSYVGHCGTVFGCAFSSDGALMVSASKDKTLKVWKVQSNSLVHTLEGHSGPVLACTFSPIGNEIVSASDDHTLRKWDSTSGSSIGVLNGHTLPVYCCVYSPDGHVIASGAGDTTVRTWDANTNDNLNVIQAHDAPVFDVQFSPDGSKLVSGGADKVIKIWDYSHSHWTLVRTLIGHSCTVWSCCFGPNYDSQSGDNNNDQYQILSSSSDGTVKVWGVPYHSGSSSRQCTYKGHMGAVNQVCPVSHMHNGSSSSGDYFVSCSTDCTIKVWDTKTGEEITTLIGHVSDVLGCCVKGKYLLSCAGDIIKLWNLERAVQRGTAGQHTD
eukprot:NODE_82_length_1686_cov_525.660038_g80_i0.p1 GENE.NODE_82_length_1686_cov_525.660038_g80_i0~~NODE_82_length_1686_cov_525.660038_g80_i0.p1  ORF type:complete len:455 (-),score=115.37 NODE_82_length_1686_cov_525.660038_g80_i0:242-1606(-)